MNDDRISIVHTFECETSRGKQIDPLEILLYKKDINMDILKMILDTDTCLDEDFDIPWQVCQLVDLVLSKN